MKKLLLLLLAIAPLSSWGVDDYYWTTPSHNSTESMPVGGGNIGMNVWVDSLTNQVLCYVSQSGWFDENNTLLKAGLLRITWDGPQTFYAPEFNPFFEQRLCLSEGHQLIRFAESELQIWVDVWKPIIHIEADAPIQVEYVSWRQQDNPLNRSNCQQSSWKWIVPQGTVTYADHILREAGENILFWHQNRDTTVFDYTVHQQQLDAYHNQLYNPLKGRIFGGHLKQHNPEHYTLTLCNAQYNTGTRAQQWEAWHQQLLDIENSINPDNDRKETQRWWNLYWHHSFIEAGQHCSDSVRLMVRNYNLFRYLIGCNAHPSNKGERWPTKFNGGLFTFHPLDADPSLLETEQETPGTFTPDYRKWGGGTHTAQNQRLVYWPLLQTGNYDALHAQFDYYLRLLPTAQLRSQHYWGIEGACFCEQLENFGLPNPAEYG
ncbi:MAG: DUF5703 domain-containing protein, partial [Treponemataceae bacterium]|nr:DUF5703 domain-containing protein [Treponemataceae bacterium]